MDLQKIREIIDNQIDCNQMPVSLKGFNWGVFLLTFIWGIKYKAWITLLAIPLIWFQLPLGLNWFLLLVLQIYCGIKGNEWAYAVDYKKSEYDFKMTQIKWAVFGFAIQIIIPLIFMLILCLFLRKSPENPIVFAQNAQCKAAYDNLKKGLLGVNVYKSENEIAEQFGKNLKNTQVVDNSVNFAISSQGQSVELYYIKFIKENEKTCNLDTRNCKIESGFLLPEEIFASYGECIFYFDNYKKILPTEQTQKNINKGYNILKYLF